MVLSGQARSNFLSSPLPPKSSLKGLSFLLPASTSKNGVSPGQVTNPLSPVKAKKSPVNTNLRHS